MDTTESIIASQKEEIAKYKERLKGERIFLDFPSNFPSSFIQFTSLKMSSEPTRAFSKRKKHLMSASLLSPQTINRKNRERQTEAATTRKNN
jgi:hypothetical protein